MHGLSKCVLILRCCFVYLMVCCVLVSLSLAHSHKWWQMKSSEAWFISEIFLSSLRTFFSLSGIRPDAFWRVCGSLIPSLSLLSASSAHTHSHTHKQDERRRRDGAVSILAHTLKAAFSRDSIASFSSTHTHWTYTRKHICVGPTVCLLLSKISHSCFHSFLSLCLRSSLLIIISLSCSL